MFTGQSPARKKVVPDSPAKPHFSRPHFRSGSLNFGSTPPSGGGGSAGTPLSLGEAVGEDGGGGVNNNGESPVRGLFSSWNAGHTMVDSPTESYNPVTQSRRVSSHNKYNNNNNPSTTTKSDRVAQEEEEAKQFAIREGLSGPRLWNDYHDIKSIGEGNFGVVFKATHDLDGQTYAIKKTTKPIISDADLQHRLQEVYALAELTGGAGLLRNGVASAASPSNNSNSCVDAASMGARYILRYYDSWVEELEGGGPAVTSLEFGEPPMRGTRGGIGNNHNGDDDGIGGGGDENALDQGCAVCIRMEYVNGGNIDKRAYTIRDPLREVCVGVVCSNRRTSISSDDRGFAASSTSTTASVPGEKRSTRSRSHDYGGEEADGRASRSKSRRSEPSPLSASERARGGGGGVETSDIDTNNMTPTINHVGNHPTNHTSTRSRSPSPQVALVEEIRTDRLSATLPPPPSCTPPQRPIIAPSPTSPSATLQSHRSATTNSLLDGGGGEVTVPFLRLLPERVLELIFHMAAALQRIHQRYGMVHLDVKPDNIFCSLNDEDDAIPTTTTPTASSRAGQKSEDRQLNSPNSPLASTTTSASPSRQSIIFKLGDFGLARQINSVSATGEIFKGVNDDEGDRRYLCPYLLSGEQPLMLESADVFSLGRSVLDLIVSSSPEIAAAGMDKRFRSLIDVPLATGACGGSSSNECEKMVAAEMSNSNSEMSTIQEQLLLEVLIGQCQPQTPLDVASSGCPLVPSDVAALVSATSPILTYHRPPNSSSQSQNNMTASPSSQSAGAPIATQFRSSMDVPNGVRIWSFNAKEAVDPSTPTMPSSQRQQFDQERTQVLAPLASLITSMVHPDPRQRPSTLYIMAAAFQILQSVQQQSSTTSTCFAPICEEDLTNLAEMEMRINTKVSAVAELEAQIEQMMATLQQEDGGGGDGAVYGFEHSGEHYHV